MSKKIGRKNSVVKAFSQNKGVCMYCSSEMTLSLGYSNTATIDHVTPKSKGGVNKWPNKVLCCYSCNQSKGSMLLCDYIITCQLNGVQVDYEWFNEHIANTPKANRKYRL